MEPFLLYRPRTLAQLHGVMRSETTYVRAGGVDLLDLLKERTAPRRSVADIAGVEDAPLLELAVTDGHARLGAAVTLNALSTFVREQNSAALRAVGQAAGQAATPLVREQATLGGNLLQRPRCWYFRDANLHCLKKGGSVCLAVSGDHRYHAIFGGGPSYIVHPSSLATPLMALDARVSVAGPAGTRNLALEDVFVTPQEDPTREHRLAHDDVLTHVDIDVQAYTQSVYRAARHAQSHDWPLAEAAIAWHVDNGRMQRVRVVLGHVAPVPWRLHVVEDALMGRTLAEVGPDALHTLCQRATHDATPLPGNRYKLSIVRAVLYDALCDMLESEEASR